MHGMFAHAANKKAQVETREKGLGLLRKENLKGNYPLII
jgi:hypothetical protein